MKTFTPAIKSLIAIAAVGTALTGMTANAQMRLPMHPTPVTRADHDRQIDGKIDNLQARITEGKRFHKLSGREASRLQGHLNAISSLKRSYERSRGLDGREVATLNARLDQLSIDIHYQGNDGNGR